jgi:hypothetical protein
MSTVFNTLHKPNGQPLRNVSVSVFLSWDTNLDDFVVSNSGKIVYDSLAKTKTDIDGYWEMDLVPNAELSPVNFYRIEERISTDNVNVYYVEVIDGATPSFWVGDLIVAKPSWEVN